MTPYGLLYLELVSESKTKVPNNSHQTYSLMELPSIILITAIADTVIAAPSPMRVPWKLTRPGAAIMTSTVASLGPDLLYWSAK